jgi:hypothetical protein
MSPRQDSAQSEHEAGEQATVPEHASEDTAIEVLRAIWDGQGQSSADLAESFGTQRSCKSMQSVGFDGMAGSDGDLRLAWQEKLRREGKLKPQADSVRDLVLGPARPGTP